MKTYYVGNIPFNGEDSISHGRTKGSKNGISHTPGYVAIGELAGKVSTAARSVGSKVSGAARSVGRTAKKTYSSGKEFITGNNAKQKRARDQRASNDINRYSTNLRSKAVENSRAAGYERGMFKTFASDPNIIRRIKNKDNIHEKATKAKEYQAAADRLRKEAVQGDRLNERDKKMNEGLYKKQHNKTLPGKIEKAKTKLGSAASKKMSEVSAWASTASGKAKEAARKAKTAVRSAGSTAISKISTGASSTTGKVKNFLSGIFGKKKK